MKGWLQASALGAFMLVTVPAADAAAGVGVGSRAPEIGMTDARGNRISMRAYRGKVVIVDVWASWCEPCKKELPALQKLYAEHFHDGLRVVGINVDSDESAMTSFASDKGVLFPNVHDPDKSAANRYGLDTMPSSYVVDHRGIVRHVNRGFRPGDAHKLEKQVESLLAKAPKSAGGGSADDEEASTPAGADTADADPDNVPDGPADAPPAAGPSEAGRSGGLCAATRGAGAPLIPAAPLLLALLVLSRRRRATTGRCRHRTP